MATTKTASVSLPDSTKSEIKNFIEQWTKLANAYFWSSPTSASARRSYENNQSKEIFIEIDNTKISGKISVSCSCKNIYVTRTLLVNGEPKRITALKNLVK